MKEFDGISLVEKWEVGSILRYLKVGRVKVDTGCGKAWI